MATLYVTVFLSVAAFLLTFVFSGITQVALNAIEISRAAVATMRDPELDEDRKEQAIQRASLQLFASLGKLIVKSGLALLAAAAPILIADILGLTNSTEVILFLSSWQAILAISAIMIGGWMLLRAWTSK